jgi:hypothetical protein
MSVLSEVAQDWTMAKMRGFEECETCNDASYHVGRRRKKKLKLE